MVSIALSQEKTNFQIYQQFLTRPGICQVKWWINDNSLRSQPCGIVYSTSEDPVNYSKGLWASKFEIYSSNQWELLFFVNAFSGVDPAEYFVTGTEVNPRGGNVYYDEIFRDPNIETKIRSARTVKFLVYNFERTEVVSEIDLDGDNSFTDWFPFSNHKFSSQWTLEPFTGARGSIFSIRTDFSRVFHISKIYDDCTSDLGWLVVSIRGACHWDKWWKQDSFTSRYTNAQELPESNQPPYILYSTSSEAQKFKEMHEGGKTEILII